VFDLAKREAVVEASTLINAFVDHLAAVSEKIEGRTVVDIDKLDLSDEVRARVIQYLSAAAGAKS
jgi:hypothetical protein